jgi:putative transposase
MDFVYDQLVNGRRIRVFTRVDDFSRVSPAIKVASSLTGRHVLEVLEQLKATRGVPKALAVDNGPEFASRALGVWAYQNGVDLDFSRPGKPTNDPFIESFNANLRLECLDHHWFTAVEEAEEVIEAWRKGYNTDRPHSALGGLPPSTFEADCGPVAAAREQAG